MNDTCICVDGGEAPSFYDEKIVKARKQHKCCECHKTIKKDEKYHFVSGMWEGGFDTYRTCLPCHGIRRDFFQCGFIFEKLWDDLWNAFAENDDDDEHANDWLSPVIAGEDR